MIIESKGEQMAIDCVLRHFNSFLKNFNNGELADFGEPCKECKYINECKVQWLSTIKPLLDNSGEKIKVGRFRKEATHIRHLPREKAYPIYKERMKKEYFKRLVNGSFKRNVKIGYRYSWLRGDSSAKF